MAMRLLRLGRLNRSRSDTTEQQAASPPLLRSRRSNSNNEPSSSQTPSDDGTTSVFRVTVPDGVEPGQEFQVYAGGRIVRVRCPTGVHAGQSLQITVPRDPNHPSASSSHHNKDSGGSSDGSSMNQGSSSSEHLDSPNVSRIEGEPNSYNVTIPQGYVGGQQFPVTIGGQSLMVTVPQNARAGMKVRVNPPPIPTGNGLERVTSGSGATNNNVSKRRSDGDNDTQLFEVQVPEGVQPGQPFALLAGGVRVLVTCPINAGPGLRIRFNLPKALMQQRKLPQNEAALIKLSYDKDGWARTIRVSDMRFQWVRMDDKGDIHVGTERFDPDKSAYVRHLEFRPGSDPRVRDGILTLVPANEAFVASSIKGANDQELVSYGDIAEAQGQSFEAKTQWFKEKCEMLRVEFTEGHMRINVRREHLLEDSVLAIMSLSRRDMRKLWRFEFIGEMGIDAGGLAREWFQLVTTEIFDADKGLWHSSETNQMCMQINPASKFACDEYHIYYRFLGRIMGKALFDQQLVNGHMVQYIYKHILGWPISFKDLAMVDEEFYNNLRQLKQLMDNGQDLSLLCLEFKTTEEFMGAKEEVELVPGGSDMEVNNDNLPEYLEAKLKYRMLDRVRPQMNELLLGFFDVIPEPLLTVFDFQELELLMCGLPEIDMEDWMLNTEYCGDFESCGPNHSAVGWFWEVVDEFDHEMKARLLQFVTGTSGVPSRGFGVLQGNDGNIRRFTINGVSTNVCLYPRAHTCFNRIDLPTYDTKEELKEKLKLAVTMVATGFDIE